jgi:transmembrane protein TMEM260 (protein O-mannosyltransferase)
MPKTFGTENKSVIITWIAFIAILVIYLTFPTRNYFFDGIDFAHTIESASRVNTSLIHPNHLIYNAVGYLFYSLLRFLGFDLRAVAALQILDSILGVLSAYVLFLILKSSLRSVYLSFCLTLLFSFSATWWKFATDADAYIASVLFLLISFYLILPEAQESPERQLRRGIGKARPFLVAFTFSVAMCFHQLAVIFFPVIVLGLPLQTNKFSWKEKGFKVVQFGATAFILTAGAYYFCFHLATGAFNPIRFLHWTTSFSPDGGFSFDLLSALTYTLRGHARLFFGGRFNLLKGLLNPLVGVLMFALAVIIGLLIYTLLKNFRKPNFRNLESLPPDQRRGSLVLLSLAWSGVYLVFLFFWMPQHTYYRLFYLPALILLAGLVIHPSGAAPLGTPVMTSRTADSGPRKFQLALIVAVLGISNFLFLVFPYSHVQKFPPLAFALEMNKIWPPGTVIYYALENSDESLFRYFNPSTVWKQLNATAPEVLENELNDIYSKGATAWFEFSAIDRFSATPGGVVWLKKHARTESLRELNDPAYKIRFIQIVPAGK